MSAAEWRTRRLVVNCGISCLMPNCSFARAAFSRAKSSPAWCEERVSGDADTIRNPLAKAMVFSASNSSGGTKRITGWCLRVGCRYCPMVRKSTPAERRSSITCSTSFRSSPRPTMMPDLVNIVGSISLTRCRSRSEAK